MKSARPFVFLLVLIALVSLACGIDFGTDTPPAASPSTQEQSSGPAATGEPVSTGQEFGTFDFDAPDDNWANVLNVTGPTTNVANMNVETKGGFLSFDVNTKDLYTYFNYTAFEYGDVRVDARVENRGTNNNNISLICRYTEDEGWYEFNIANNGLYSILHGIIQTGGTPVYSLIYNGGSNKIKQGKDVNEYTAICKGRTLSLLINGSETRTVEDNKYVLRDGQVGISVSSFADLPVKVDFDWIKLSQP